MSHNTSDSAISVSIHSICERIGSTRSQLVQRAISSNTYIPQPPIDFSTSCVTSLAEEYMLSKLLSKYKGFNKSVPSPEINAVNNWLVVEDKCQSVNNRLKNLMRGTGYPGSDLITIISMAQRHISLILGSFSLRRVLNGCGWGPGATQDLPRGTCRDRKMIRRMSTTREAMPFMKIMIESDPNWIEAITGYYPDGPVSLMKDYWNIIDHSRFSTVAKKWDIDRIIDIQPTANGYLQKGVGSYMRTRLLKFGIDLNSQEHNQNAAREGVRNGEATVDLRDASDSVALELCTLLLPWQWMQYLTALRTRSTVGGPLKKPHKLNKISSMGNGFTFELETILFLSITRAVCEFEQLSWDRVLVYGDDIVCPNQAFDRLVTTFDYFGFSINTEKSFHSGEFRESCGRHFFRGAEVTPIYQKSLVNSPEEAIRFHNRIVRWSERTYGDPWRFEVALTVMIDYYCASISDRPISAKKIPKIPLGFVSDDGFLAPISDFEVDNNGGCITTVFRRSRQKKKEHRFEDAYLSLKFSSTSVRQCERRVKPVFYYLGLSLFNSNPRGSVEEDTGRGRYRPKQTYIYSVNTIPS